MSTRGPTHNTQTPAAPHNGRTLIASHEAGGGASKRKNRGHAGGGWTSCRHLQKTCAQKGAWLTRGNERVLHGAELAEQFRQVVGPGVPAQVADVAASAFPGRVPKGAASIFWGWRSGPGSRTAPTTPAPAPAADHGTYSLVDMLDAADATTRVVRGRLTSRRSGADTTREAQRSCFVANIHSGERARGCNCGSCKG